MDGQVQAIRRSLDAAGFTNTAIMSYSTKFASSFYGPFREAAGTALKGDRKTYQMSPMNRREAIRESLLDEAQGADCLMVKPAGAYLDILRDIRERSDLPLGAYQVSGEYAMIKFAAQAGAIDEEKVVLESLGAIKTRRRRPDLQLFRPRSGREKDPPLNPPLPRWRCAYRGPQAYHECRPGQAQSPPGTKTAPYS
ncbi:Porphobilinogen synthase [Klebsiella pneumoniae IS43]|uniref:Delta-aminolevulinic acid dehydratase n=1 Tax=Klebsiella pneumoniae IS43 TaxID=1432552 RepID=W1DLP8_KLEPN|nr:Porphobilinogen synthase [Klebsiella pneumoniae IS43]